MDRRADFFTPRHSREATALELFDGDGTGTIGTFTGTNKLGTSASVRARWAIAGLVMRDVPAPAQEEAVQASVDKNPTRGQHHPQALPWPRHIRRHNHLRRPEGAEVARALRGRRRGGHQHRRDPLPAWCPKATSHPCRCRCSSCTQCVTKPHETTTSTPQGYSTASTQRDRPPVAATPTPTQRRSVGWAAGRWRVTSAAQPATPHPDP